MALGRRLTGGNAGGRSRARSIAAAACIVGVGVAAVAADRPEAVEAQDPFVPAELVSFGTEGFPLFADADNLSMSALGHVVSFEHDAEAYLTMMRVRPDAATVVPVPAPPSANHGLSDDGCVVAYTGPVTFGAVAVFRSLNAFNRCTGGTPTLIGQTPSIRPRPALDADGSVIAFGGPGGVILTTLAGGVVQTQVGIPAPDSTWSVSELAISDDGNTIAMITGPDVDGNGFLEQSNLYMLDSVLSYNPDVGPAYTGIAENAYNPTMSGDGTLVAYIAGNVATVLDRSAGANRPVGGANTVYLSNDGHHLALQLFAGDSSFIYVTSSSDRWTSFTTPEFMSYMLPGASGFSSASEPVLAAHGRWVGWISPNAALYVDQPPNIGQFPDRQALVRERRPVLQVQSIDFGTTPGPIDRPATVTNVGPSGWVVTAIETPGEFQVRSENCPDVLHPGQSCTVVVRYLAQTVGQVTGELRVRDNSYPGLPLVASGRLVGRFDPDEPPVDTTTTTTTVPDTPPDTVPPSTGLSISPTPIVFADSIVGQAAPAQVATVRNIGQVAVTVQTVGITGSNAVDFGVADNDCADETLAPGATCEITVGFTPTDAGARSGTIGVTGTGATSASAALRGNGHFDAVLSVLPEVAGGGQVVTVTGEGYPASSSIGVTLGGSAPQTVATDPTGRFTAQWLILSGTPQGTLFADDVATSRFDAEEVPLVVVPSPMRPQATATLNRIDRIDRTQVSR